ncbi:MAG: hypothetical protein FWF63_03710 [Fibromonadales bacterium]|nr:hypothetical protein [Fibromonadales bacterium]
MKKIFIFAFFLLSCTHWLIETKTRIQVENSTGNTISGLCIVSKSGQRNIFISESIKSGDKSAKVHEVELVGEFDFEVLVEDNWKPLGPHKLEGGSVLARITKKDGIFNMVLK